MGGMSMGESYEWISLVVASSVEGVSSLVASSVDVGFSFLLKQHATIKPTRGQ